MDDKEGKKGIIQMLPGGINKMMLRLNVHFRKLDVHCAVVALDRVIV
jgi:hypothetical protein